jgi:hypothetical protein
MLRCHNRVKAALHGSVEPRPRVRITIPTQLQHDVVDRVSPLTEGNEVVETLEHHVFVDAILGTGFPAIAEQSPELWRQRILFAECHIDHR